MKLVQMPTDLLHLDEAELSAVGVAPRLLEAFRLYLPRALDDRRGAAMLAPPSARTRELLMVLARRVGATLRDENIRLRERGGDLRSGRKKLCYLPGRAVPNALHDPIAHRALTHEAACFIQDLETAWPEDQIGRKPFAPTAVLALIDERCAAGRPTFITADPARLPSRARARLTYPLVDPGDVLTPRLLAAIMEEPFGSFGWPLIAVGRSTAGGC